MYIERLAYYLSILKGIELHIVRTGDKDRQFKKGRIEIHTIKKRSIYHIPIFTPILLWLIKRKVEEIDPDVVHAIGTSFLYSTVAAFVRKRYPTLLRPLGMAKKEIIYRKDIPLIMRIINLINERYVISVIPNILVETISIKRMISGWTRSKIHVVPNGIEFKNIIDKCQIDTSSRSDILLISNLERHKGIDLLVKSIPIVLRSVSDLKVFIAGVGPEEDELKRLAKELGLNRYIEFLGYISERDKYRYLKITKIFVIPSRWENSPITLFEAMAAGIPVIGSNVGGIPDVLEDGKTGFIFESEDIPELAYKIVKLLKNEELRKKMGQAAQEKAKEYEWKGIVKRIFDIYEESIKEFRLKI
jgi:glycosyltransferase involved in cell wall biosynthesis